MLCQIVFSAAGQPTPPWSSWPPPGFRLLQAPYPRQNPAKTLKPPNPGTLSPPPCEPPSTPPPGPTHLDLRQVCLALPQQLALMGRGTGLLRLLQGLPGSRVQGMRGGGGGVQGGSGMACAWARRFACRPISCFWSWHDWSVVRRASMRAHARAHAHSCTCLRIKPHDRAALQSARNASHEGTRRVLATDLQLWEHLCCRICRPGQRCRLQGLHLIIIMHRSA